jgi:hypothetical protein
MEAALAALAAAELPVQAARTVEEQVRELQRLRLALRPMAAMVRAEVVAEVAMIATRHQPIRQEATVATKLFGHRPLTAPQSDLAALAAAVPE